jgi:hypothetical protein
MIKSILYAQPVFAPDKMRLDRNVNSIKSFGQYLKVNGNDGMAITIAIGGWAKDDALWEEIVNACKEAFGGKVIPIRFDRNYGKATVVNKLVSISKEQGAKFDAILTADSDILYPVDTANMLARLAIAALKMEARKGKPFGMISLNQLGAGCHWKVCYENVVEYELKLNKGVFKEKIVWPNMPSGIAGGCLFVSRNLWDATGGYRVLGVYSGDDAFLLVDCFQKGFSYQMSDSIAIVHPPEDDAEYAKWKVTVCQRDSLTGYKSNLDPIIKEADEFWEQKDKNK